MNWITIIAIGVATVVMIFFIVINQKREKEYEDFSNNDYAKKMEKDLDLNNNR